MIDNRIVEEDYTPINFAIPAASAFDINKN